MSYLDNICENVTEYWRERLQNIDYDNSLKIYEKGKEMTLFAIKTQSILTDLQLGKTVNFEGPNFLTLEFQNYVKFLKNIYDESKNLEVLIELSTVENNRLPYFANCLAFIDFQEELKEDFVLEIYTQQNCIFTEIIPKNTKRYIFPRIIPLHAYYPLHVILPENCVLY